MFDGIKSAISGIGKHLLDVGNFYVDKTKVIGQQITSGLKNIGGTISTGVSHVGKGLEKVGNKIGGFFGSKNMLCLQLFLSS